VAILLSLGLALTAIASIGSAVALVVFALVSAGHLRVRHETGANLLILLLGIALDLGWKRRRPVQPTPTPAVSGS
jgi:hypothetical protein